MLMHPLTSIQEALDYANLNLGHNSTFSSVTSYLRNSLLKNENIRVRNRSTLFVLQNRLSNGKVPETMAVSPCYSAKASCAKRNNTLYIVKVYNNTVREVMYRHFIVSAIIYRGKY